eukprot:TRINITY_DN8628_c0_g5_i1.p1 TRINITY_DN8628_c0_g5~~TRINITY_DN8628_c0_g5_i1.p1  ORF type:complete len:204 (-),score=29.45 TRINITY_DN8628_c0_g5_i1:50-661(-)
MAWEAKTTLDGTLLMGMRIRIEIDCTTNYLSTILVHGLENRVRWQDLMNYFRQVGTVKWATTWACPGINARVAFQRISQAQLAKKRNNGANDFPMQEAPIRVTSPIDWDSNSAEVIVTGLRMTASEDMVREYFSQIGKVEEVELMRRWEVPFPIEFVERRLKPGEQEKLDHYYEGMGELDPAEKERIVDEENMVMDEMRYSDA